ncbi:MAG: MFS transporter [Deltaproteobacteria bacterium]|nr:MFS transporter [Deltaproteobacteria bacterium]
MEAARPDRPAVHGYRWVVLLVFSLLNLVIQLQWLTFAPVARQAQLAYGVGPLAIDALSLVFMLVYVVTCLPASHILDRYGIRVGVGAGAVLTGVFGLFKGFADSWALVLVAQLGLAIAQPLIINAGTKVAAQWFPIHERATAVGLATLAQFLGIIVVMILTPLLVTTDSTGTPDLSGMLYVYGILSVVVAALVLLLLRERPPTPPGVDLGDERLLDWRAIGHMLKQRDMRLLIALFFIGLGVFNALSTCIDQLCALKGLDEEQTGLVGGVMLIAGVVGAAILPVLSDRMRKRRPFLILAMALTTPALVGLTLAAGYVPLLIASAVLGFFLLGGGAPVGFQYAAEVSYPAAESVSQGIILLVGQLSGIVFILAINALGILPLMWVFAALSLTTVAIAIALRESPRVGTSPTPEP